MHVVTFQIQNPKTQNIGNIDDAFEEFFKVYNSWYEEHTEATFAPEFEFKKFLKEKPEPGTAENPFKAENGCIITWAASK